MSAASDKIEHDDRDVLPRHLRPVVALPGEILPGAAIAAVAILAAVFLFAVLNGQRVQESEAPRTGSARGTIASPAPLVLSRDQAIHEALPSPVARFPSRGVPLPRTSTQFPGYRQRFDASAPRQSSEHYEPTPPSYGLVPQLEHGPTTHSGTGPALVIDDGLARYTARSGTSGTSFPIGETSKSELAPTRAERIADTTHILSVGTLIPAVLETPIDSARPGLVRAVVSNNVRGFDGSLVLVPRGSRLIGEYRSDVRPGQNRVLITWSRLVRPDGVQVKLDSPVADALGGAGIRGRVNSFFLARFANAILQTALTVGANRAMRSDGDTVVVALPNGQVGQIAGESLFPTQGLEPKIKVKHGAAINVFVARDLDFGSAGEPAP